MKKLFAFISAAMLTMTAQILMAQMDKATIRFAVDPNYPPLEFIDSNNQIAGFGVDYLTAACRESGLKAEFLKIEWDHIFTGLDEGKYEAVMSSVTITPERRQTMDFTIPYYVVRQSLLVPQNSELKNIRQLGGQRVGTQADTTATEIVEKINGARSMPYPSIEEAIIAMAAGEIDAVICEDVVGSSYLPQPEFSGKIKMATRINTPGAEELYAVAVKKNNLDVMVAINDGIKAMKENGIEAELHRKWFASSGS